MGNRERKRTYSGSSQQNPIKPVGAASSTLYNRQPEGLRTNNKPIVESPYQPIFVPPTAEEAARLAHQTPPHTSPTTVADAEEMFAYSTTFRKTSIEPLTSKPTLTSNMADLPNAFDTSAAERQEAEERRRALIHSVEADPAHQATPSAFFSKLTVEVSLNKFSLDKFLIFLILGNYN